MLCMFVAPPACVLAAPPLLVPPSSMRIMMGMEMPNASRSARVERTNVRDANGPVSSGDASSCSSSAETGTGTACLFFLLEPFFREDGGSGGASQSSRPSPSPISLIRSGAWLRDVRMYWVARGRRGGRPAGARGRNRGTRGRSRARTKESDSFCAYSIASACGGDGMRPSVARVAAKFTETEI